MVKFFVRFNIYYFNLIFDTEYQEYFYRFYIENIETINIFIRSNLFNNASFTYLFSFEDSTSNCIDNMSQYFPSSRIYWLCPVMYVPRTLHFVLAIIHFLTWQERVTACSKHIKNQCNFFLILFLLHKESLLDIIVLFIQIFPFVANAQQCTADNNYIHKFRKFH